MAAGLSRTHAMEVRLAGSDDSVTHEGRLFGAVPGRYLIAGGFGGVEFKEGDELVVKTTIGGYVIGFWAKVEQRFDGKERLYLLSYPRQVEELNLRKAERLNVMIPVEMQLSGGAGSSFVHVKAEGFLLNLSGQGCLLSSERDWPEDMRCELKFSLPGERETFAVTGQVVRMNREGERVANFGVQFGEGAGNSAALVEIREWISGKRAFLTC